MKKVIVMVRTSTESQQIEDQHNEMVQFCKSNGYDEDQIIFVETQGASAGKMDDEYLDMIQIVKERIMEDKEIDCFAVWHINRAVRNEKVFYDLKEFLVKHNVQMLVKNPNLRLLNEDGSINMGMELAFSLMVTLAKQDNEERKAKFKRAKDVMWKKGKSIGGNIKYGYTVDESGYIVPDENDAPFVRKVFELYSTGKYSARTLYDELTERGYDTSYPVISRILSDRAYIDSPYPPLISRELFDRCEDVRKKNYIGIPKGKRYCFASGIFKCHSCGRNMIAEGAQYRCWHHNRYSSPPYCDNSITIRVENLDGLLWWIASKEEIMYRMKMDDKRKDECKEKIDVLKEKIETAKKKLDYIEEKRNRIIELYVEGNISKEEKEKRLSGTVIEVKTYNDTILKFEERIGALLALLEGDEEYKITEEKLKSIYDGVISENDLEIMESIVKKHIKMVTSSAVWFGRDRDKRAVRENAHLITVDTVYSGEKKYIYVARKYKGHYFFQYRTDGSERPLYAVRKIVRPPMGKLHPRAFKSIKNR